MTTQTQPAAKPAQTKTADPKATDELIDKILDQTTGLVEGIAERYQSKMADDSMSMIRRNVLTGATVRKLREALNKEIMSILMSELMNSPLGFLTDRGPHIRVKNDDEKWKQTPYSADVVKDAAIQALLHRLSWCNNEWNILVGRCYITQVGYERKVRETEGLTDLVYSVSPSFVMQGVNGKCVRACASWRMHGIPDKLVGTDGKDGLIIPISDTGKGTEDQIRGKGLRKLLCAVYRQANGSTKSLPDPEPDEVVSPTPETKTANGETKPAETEKPKEELRDEDFQRYVYSEDEKAVAAKACAHGELVTYVIAEGGKKGKSADLALWPAADGKRDAFVKKIIAAFYQQRIEAAKAQQEKQPAPAAPDEPAPGEVIGAERIASIRSRMDDLEITEKELLNTIGLPDLGRVDYFTEAQAAKAERYLAAKEGVRQEAAAK